MVYKSTSLLFFVVVATAAPVVGIDLDRKMVLLSTDTDEEKEMLMSTNLNGTCERRGRLLLFRSCTFI